MPNLNFDFMTHYDLSHLGQLQANAVHNCCAQSQFLLMTHYHLSHLGQLQASAVHNCCVHLSFDFMT